MENVLMLPQNLCHSSSWSNPLLLLFAFVRGDGPTPDVCDEFVQVLYQSKSWFVGHEATSDLGCSQLGGAPQAVESRASTSCRFFSSLSCWIQAVYHKQQR